MDTYIEKNKIIGMIKATPLVEGHEDACRMTLKMACEVLEGELDTALTQSADQARAEGEEKLRQALQIICDMCDGNVPEQEQIWRFAYGELEALSANTKN